MSTIDESGPAFPLDSNQYGAALGMSLRDYLAAKAMGGMIANVVKGHVSYGNTEDLATRAYEVADEMLAARSQP